MFKASVLVRNLESKAESLDFGEFNISVVGPRFEGPRKVFSSLDVNEDDWVLEKSYAGLPPGVPGSPVGGIPDDIEEILLLLRLRKTGDISFIRQAITPPSGNAIGQLPYRAMNDLNSYASLRYKVESGDPQSWGEFADTIRQGRSWRANWFAAARRFFLSGGAKPFNPRRDDVDRIVDYATALEAALVPEKDYNTNRITRRAAALLAPNKTDGYRDIVRFLTRFYDVRSRIVHGNRLTDESRVWLNANCVQLELLVRQILVAAVQTLPPEEEARTATLAGLYDLTDEDRGSRAFEKFKEIKTAEVRKAVAAKIALLD